MAMNATGFEPQARYLTDSGRLNLDSRHAHSALDTNNRNSQLYTSDAADH